MNLSLLSQRIISLPKAELHLHLEGSIEPATVCELTARHGVKMSEQEVRQRYAYRDFPEFIEAFKWVTSFLREPQDYALIAQGLAESLLAQNVVYAEITLSVGVMLLRKQQPEAIFEALVRATEPFERRGLRMNWVFDAVRQFGADAAVAVVEAAMRCNSRAIVAFGIGGDELSVPTKEFRAVYDRVSELGIHKLIHAGEVGGPEKIRESIELLGVERIGHGTAAINDPALMDLLAERKIPLEICSQSNLKTGALARQLCRTDVKIEDHPLPKLFRRGIPVVLSTDDPAMFHTTLQGEYANATRMGLQEDELVRIVDMGFEHSFRSSRKKRGV
ncbi:MAG TPA: adenosine deaminase [Candidatus Acidoferrum sp.]|jgi:adenosine deaminase|nr:adenosine deaminase [Candidatus Acidoferrum sp.]